MRTHKTQLPNTKELGSILSTATSRKVSQEKQNLHYPEFDLAKKWLEYLSLKTTPFSQNLSWQETIEVGQQLQQEVADKTLELVKNNDQDFLFLLSQVRDYLGEIDPIPSSPASIIIPFGGKNMNRIQRAIELWQAGIAPLILTTGKSPTYEQHEKPEAIIFKEYAISHGVPADKILVESESTTIPDNVRNSLNLLDKQKIDYSQGICFVIVWYAVRRTWSFLKKYLPDSIPLYRNSCLGDDFTNPDQWFKNADGIKIIFNEFIKMRIGVLTNTA